MPDTMRIVRLTQVRLTRAQVHRLIETYGCGDVPREDALERVTEATVTAYDAPRGDRVELDTNVSGEPVSWLAQDEIDRLIFDTESTPPPGGLPSQPPPDGHPISTDARAWQRLWRDGDIITEADGDDPGMPRRGRRKRMARVTSLGIRGRVSTARNVARR